jgi:eukaryotic-like serine/threonine-protein kinase
VLRMFCDEARLLGMLAHEGVRRLYDLEEDRGTIFQVLELIDGPTLAAAHRLAARTGGEVPVAVAVAIAQRVAAILHAVHKSADPDTHTPLRVVHRDVCAQNILLGRDGAVKLIDFGTAHSGPGRSLGIFHCGETSAGVLKGRLSHLAPEQIQSAPIDHRTDLFALGNVLFELLTGALPFAHPDPTEILRRIREEVAPSLASIQPELPSALSALVAALLQKAPSDRPADAAAVANTLADVLQGLVPGGVLDEASLQAFTAREVAALVASLQLPSLAS